MMLIDAQNAWSDSVVGENHRRWKHVELRSLRCRILLERSSVCGKRGHRLRRDGDRNRQEPRPRSDVHRDPNPGLVEDVELSAVDCNDIYVMIQSDGVHHSIDGGHTLGATLSQGLNLVPPGTWPGSVVNLTPEKFKNSRKKFGDNYLLDGQKGVNKFSL